MKNSPRLGLRIRNSVILALLISTTLVLLVPHRAPSILPLGSLGRNTESLSSIIALTHTSSKSSSLPPPSAHDHNFGQKTYCKQRYTAQYLETLRDGEASYCSPNSPSHITCFHTPAELHEDGHRDSFCIGQGSGFNFTTKIFQLECSLKPDVQIPLSKLHLYWYQTGPRLLFRSHITINNNESAWRHSTVASANRTFTILVKREIPANIFHTFHEIMSMTYSLDVLGMSRDPQTGKPRFSQEDMANTQVVIMDDHEDGPFFELWRLVSGRPIKRLNDLVGEDPEWLTNSGNTIILPLVGGANPVWHHNPDKQDCINELRDVFSRRVLDFYQIPQEQARDATRGEDAPLTLTFVNRTDTRRLNHAEGLLDGVRARFSPGHVRVQSVDFASIPLREQIEIARGTDILVGVHGAGLTHALFMNKHRGAVVEIFPASLDFDALRAVAMDRGLGYQSTHNTTREGIRPWQEENLNVDEEVFVDLIDHAVKSLDSRVGAL